MNRLTAVFERVYGGYRACLKAMANPSKPYYVPNVIAAFMAAFFMISAMFMRFAPVSYTELQYVESIQALVFVGAILLMTAALMGLVFLLKAERVLPTALVVSVTLFCAFLQKGGDRNIWIGLGSAVVVYLTCIWIFRRFKAPFSKLKVNRTAAFSVVTALFVIFVGYMSLMGVSRFYSFTYDTFDFGIFAQMFDYMKYTGLPYTTVERGSLLSHFAVHFSPFFYLLLPGYFVFSTPAYLCVMQTLFVGLGVFAVYGIAEHFGFTPKQSVLVSALYLLYPAISFGLHFDFHENKFLAVCILFTVYFMLKRRFIPYYICGLLICMVKEDAAIYLIAIGLFMILHERLFKHGILTVVLAFAYFFFAMRMIQVCGAEEGMQFGYRYSNYELAGEVGVANIVKITFLDLGYTLQQIFVHKDPEQQLKKIEFLLWIFLPVLFTPFMNRRIAALTLLTPMLLVNLMTNWPYQYDIDFQYTYGTAAMVIVCVLLALRRMKPKRRNALLLATVMLCISLTVPRVIARNNGYIKGYFSNRAQFHAGIELIHDTLSKDSVIGVEGNVMPVMYDYPCLYLDPHDDEKAAKIEYFVSKKGDSDIHHLTDRGFELYAENDYIVIYKNPTYQAPVAAN